MCRTRGRAKEAGKPTRDDVARAVNVSGATVSRVLSRRTDLRIAPGTRAKVLQAAEMMGYVPNTAARALTGGRSGLIGLWTTKQYAPYSAQVLHVVRRCLGESGMTLAVVDVDEEYQREGSFVRSLRVPVDGILAFDNSVSISAFAVQRNRLAPGIPFVSMGAFWSPSLSYVGVDLREGAKLAMRHLIGLGRRRIAYLVPTDSGFTDRGARFETYTESMEAAGLPRETILVPSADVSQVLNALAERRSQSRFPEAILCFNDDCAIAVASALQRMGIRPGYDVALVGFDGILETEQAVCPLSTVRQPIEAMCALALEFLLAQIEDPAAPLQQRLLIPELVVRESSHPVGLPPQATWPHALTEETFQ